ncbi:MAG TPA: S-layer homology domain-containing protein, partial [Brevibacillus sp.]|nr:S-layer homology domain-containing protein [Brevibacillus sp.]
TLPHELYWNEHSETKTKLGSTEEYSVTFQRYVNGVKAATGSSAVSFDPTTGEILYYNADIGKEAYPAQIPDHLSAEEASEAWWKEAEIEPVFMLEQLTPEDQKKIRQQPAFIPSRSAKLVYRANSTVFDEPYFLDAVSGEWRSQASGKAVVLHRIDPVDLDGHPAAKELLLMYEYDALSLEDGKLLPDKTITRGEMIEMLMISINRGRYFPIYSSEREASFSDVSKQSRYFSAVENAVDSGLLDKQSSKLNPDEAITREELADMIVRALGYKNLAQYSNMFQSDLTDIANSPKRGSIIIATTLGIVPTDKQTFRPQATVSRADAAITFSRFLEKRSEQDTQPSVPR